MFFVVVGELLVSGVSWVAACRIRVVEFSSGRHVVVYAIVISVKVIVVMSSRGKMWLVLEHVELRGSIVFVVICCLIGEVSGDMG